jgi:hypothetical protein
MNLSDIRTCPDHRGKRELLKHTDGRELTYKEAVSAKCFECCCGYLDGRHDCKVPDCPIYGFMPYREIKPTRAKRGTEEQRKAAGDRLRAMRKLKRTV